MDDVIEHWRRSLADLSSEQVTELEDHVRAEAAALCEGGLSEREAFMVATMRCGRVNDLAEQYEHADAALAWSRRLRWMAMGFAVCMFVNWIVMAVNNGLGLALIRHGVGTWWTIFWRYFALTGLIAVVIAGWHVLLRYRPGMVTWSPPRWWTSGLTLSIAVALLPWINAGWQLMGYAVAANMSSKEWEGYAVSSVITWYTLPFTTPLVLVIIAIGLSKRAARADVTRAA